jgi:hypothetical protein
MTGRARADVSRKDVLAGLAFIAFGLAFGAASLGYQLGTALRMGPGYFPLVLAGLLVLLGVVIVAQAGAAGADRTPIGRVPWRGLALLVGALVFFGLTVRGLGLAPSLFLTALASALASRRTGPIGAVLIAAVLTLLCVAIFSWGLGVPLPLLGPWLRFG